MSGPENQQLTQYVLGLAESILNTAAGEKKDINKIVANSIGIATNLAKRQPNKPGEANPPISSEELGEILRKVTDLVLKRSLPNNYVEAKYNLGAGTISAGYSINGTFYPVPIDNNLLNIVKFFPEVKSSGRFLIGIKDGESIFLVGQDSDLDQMLKYGLNSAEASAWAKAHQDTLFQVTLKDILAKHAESAGVGAGAKTPNLGGAEANTQNKAGASHSDNFKQELGEKPISQSTSEANATSVASAQAPGNHVVNTEAKVAAKSSPGSPPQQEASFEAAAKSRDQEAAVKKIYPEENEKAPAGGKVKSNGNKPPTNPSTPNHPQETDQANPSEGRKGSNSSPPNLISDPIDVTTGDYLQIFPVITIPGLLPITLTRIYRSTSNLSGLLGPKWIDDWSRQLVIDNEKIHFTDADGQVYDFSTPENQILARNRHLLHCLLTGEIDGELRLINKQSQQTFHFNSIEGNRRRLSAITDRHQNSIQFIYDNQHRLVEIVRNDGFRLSLHYQDEKLQAVDYHFQQIQQRLVTCRYDQHGYLAECDAFQQNHLWHKYTAQGFMTRWHDTDKTDFYIHYDECGRAVSVDSSSGYWSDRFIYDDDARVTTYLDAEGGKTLFYYNQNNRVIRKIDPLGRETRTQWRYSQKVWEIDPLGGYTTFGYNNDGALIETALPTGEAFYYDYDEHGQLIKSILPTGDIWYFHHDEQGNLTAVTNPQGHREEYQYGIHGELRQRQLPDGRQWHYAYDEYQRLAAIMTPDGQTTGLELDELGRLRRTADALKQETRYRYSPVHASLNNGSLTEVESPDGVTQHMEYDSERRIVAVTDGEGRTTRYGYGAFDLLTHITRPDGTTLHFGYDRLTRFCSVTASTGETYRYERDAAGQIIRETDFTGRTIDYQYDALGRRTQARYPDNHLLRWYYSSAGLLTRQETWYQAGDQQELKSTTIYEYNSRRQIIRAVNDDAVVEYEYDVTGLPICERINGREITREWDNLTGQLTAETIGEHTLRFGYNVMETVNHFQFNQHTPLTLSHDALGREIVRESAEGFILASRYTSTGLLAHQSAGRVTPLFRETVVQNDPHFPPQATAVNRSWQYDRAYSVRRIDDGIWGQTRYRYNQNDQVISATFNGRLPYEEQFRYDANGNLNQHMLVDAQGIIERFEQHQQAGRVIQRDNVTYRYDDNGRQVEKTEHRDGFRPQVWRYHWDTQNQLTHCETPDGSRWHYRYDAFGRRIRKLKVHDGKLAAANLQRWLDGKPDLMVKPDTIMGYDYFWNGDQLVEETPLYADGTPDYDHSICWLYKPEALMPSARYEKGKLHYIVSDHQGTPREILSEDGKLVWANRLTTWGKAERIPLLATNDEDYHVSCNLRFAGQYEDKESGLYYNRFRYYDCETGQYITPDPIGLAGGMNPYSYVSNPLKWIDPLGLVGSSVGQNPQEDLSKSIGRPGYRLNIQPISLLGK
ncbi:RHS repeat-associated core domain-containing protein [Xenorhabdus khoisanae]|uniref:RHS repeat-associated core domain-containing protein n=1 Tax=Xenorhabdus khoisanae TaxID=880157 RepID=UPI00069F108F|nr:RHS repeat-associated core domain-containing protein [Xenorhabdus khoisanae]